MRKATGVVRKLDELGRIVVPKEIRRTLDINDGDAVEIYVDGEEIILKKYQTGCALCGNMENLHQSKGKLVCLECIHALTAIK